MIPTELHDSGGVAARSLDEREPHTVEGIAESMAPSFGERTGHDVDAVRPESMGAGENEIVEMVGGSQRATYDSVLLSLLSDRDDFAIGSAPLGVAVAILATATGNSGLLRLMASGATSGEIAGELFVAETTVKSHVGAIFTKLGVRDRSAAIIHAFDAGVVTPRRG